jgi:hypothetical protein
MLAGNANPEAETWALRPEVLPALASAVRLVSERCPDGFAFWAEWATADSPSHVGATSDELLADIQSNRIRNRIAYEVSGTPV